MTTTIPVIRRCGRCGKFSNFTAIMFEYAFEPFDLDDRPPEEDWDALQYKVQECPHCGYAADDLSLGTIAPDALFESEEYLSYGGIPFSSELAKKFYRLYLVKRAVEDVSGAFYAALHGAWASDDARDVAVAVKCRRLALEQLEILESRASNPEKWTLMKFDLLRRVREFDAVVEGVLTFHSNRRFYMNFAALELELAKREDDARHTYDEVDGYYDEDEDEDEDEVVDDDEDLDEDDYDGEDEDEEEEDCDYDRDRYVKVLNGDFDADCDEDFDWDFEGDGEREDNEEYWGAPYDWGVEDEEDVENEECDWDEEDEGDDDEDEEE